MRNSGTAQAVVDSGHVPVAGFVPLHVKDVVRETPDAVSVVFHAPESAENFSYRAGQFLTLSVRVGGTEHRRCYSMSSSPAVGEDLRITVKRDRDGVVSNWLNDTVTAGDQIHAAPPAGRFVLCDSDRDLVAFAGGSGITPVYSLLRTALASSTRRCRLLYANRNRESVIFDDALATLQDSHAERLTVVHHLDDDRGVVTAGDIASFVAGCVDADLYVCGPTPFMDTVEKTLLGAGVPAQRLHLERFTVATQPGAPGLGGVTTEEVTIELEGRITTAAYRDGNTLLQTARLAGLRAPSSCETGSCGTCIAQITEGSARMLNNDALDDDEVADGLVLTCQSLPTSPTVTVVYE